MQRSRADSIVCARTIDASNDVLAAAGLLMETPAHPPLSMEMDEFLAKRSQFDIDHDHIWQAYADRSGNGSYLKKMAQ